MLSRKPNAWIDGQRREIEFLESKYPIGSEFVYLGKTMLVIGHHGGLGGGYNCVSCHYCDDSGSIREIELRMPIARALCER